MNKGSEEVLSILRKTGAFLEGHFLLSSGLHSNRYVQCALILQHPKYAEYLGKNLAKKFSKRKINVVVSPAIGGIVIGQEVGRALGKRAIFAEREEGKLVLRRGFDIKKDERILIVEDVLTTGGSVKEIIGIARKKGARLVGVGCIVNRSTGDIKFEVPLKFLLRLKIENYKPQKCPLCKQGLPLVKPGSRFRKK